MGALETEDRAGHSAPGFRDAAGTAFVYRPQSLRPLTAPKSTNTARLSVHAHRLRFGDQSAARLSSAVPLWPLTLVGVLIGLSLWDAMLGLWALVMGMAAFYSASLIFKLALALRGATGRLAEPPALSEARLPTYTVIVPLFREAGMVRGLIEGLSRLDYPRHKLDIRLVLEPDDWPTRHAVETLEPLPPWFTVIVAPAAGPRTKPKACNAALEGARGELTVIYDAEDRPETDQLRKAAARLAAAPPEVACAQARLSFYNARDNWLARLFTLDYGLWFDYLLPGLEQWRLPIPLGGTSNHLRTDVLKALRGWDPYNVTEDADLGLRLMRAGFRTVTVDSTTYEEANNRIGSWVRQRTRWLKGYAITWLVHMRHPVSVVRTAGLRGFLSVQLFVGGAVMAAVLNPVMLLIALGFGIEALWLGTLSQTGIAISAINWALVNGAFICLFALGAARRRLWDLTPYALLAPAYWLLMSYAGYRAMAGLVSAPFHWDKTEHGHAKRPPQTAVAQ